VIVVARTYPAGIAGLVQTARDGLAVRVPALGSALALRRQWE
jgi:hypothetical protein